MTNPTLKPVPSQAPEASASARTDTLARGDGSTANGPLQTTPLQPAPLLASPTAALSGLGSQIGGALTQAVEQQRAEQRTEQLTAFTWSAVTKVLTKVVPSISPDDRRRVEDLQNQLQLILEEKKKQRKGFDARDPAFFERLAAVLGQRAAEQLAQQIEQVVSEQGAALQNDPKAVAELLGALLASGDTLIKFGVSPQAVENSLREALAPARLANFGLVPLSFAPANLPIQAAPIIGADLVAAVRAEPNKLAHYLTTPEGARLLRERLVAAQGFEQKSALLFALKEILGAERFAALVNAYDTHTGVPLVASVVQMLEPAIQDQQAVLRKLLSPELALLTAVQRERLSQYVVADAALVLRSLRSEYEGIQLQLAEIERSRAAHISHLAEVLGLGEFLTADPRVVEAQMLRALNQRYPGLRATSLEAAENALKELVSPEREDPAKFREAAKRLGLVVLPEQSDRTGNTPHETQQIYEEHRRKIRDEMSELKDIASRTVTHLEDIRESTSQLETLRGMQSAGPAGELEAVFTRLQQTYAASIPDFTRERVNGAQQTFDVYLDNLQLKISSETDSRKIQALSLERDSIEWRALQARIPMLLTRERPDVGRVFALLNEFRGAHVDRGPSRRNPEYLQAAAGVAESLQGIINYYAEADRLLAVEAAEAARVRSGAVQKLDEAEPEVQRLEELVNSWGWVSYREDYKRSLANYQANTTLWTLQKQNSEEKQKRLEACRERLVEQQRTVLFALGNGRSIVNLGITPDELKTQLDSHETVSTQSLDTLKSMQAQAIRGCAHGISMLSRPDLLGRASCLSDSFSLSASEAVRALHSRITQDVTVEPTSEALVALRAVVAPDSVIARVLDDPYLATRSTREQMDILYARIGSEDVLRVKIFLLAHDQPGLMARLGIEGADEAQGVWREVLSRREDPQNHDLANMLSVVMPLRAVLAAQRVFESVPESERGALAAEYQRLASQSVGQMLLGQAPIAADARRIYLSELAGSSFVSATDLAPLFANSTVPNQIEERRNQLNALLARDSQKREELPPDLLAVIQEQSEQRAALLTALPTMIQLGRTADVETIRRRLAELDSHFLRTRDFELSIYSADYMARNGLQHVADSLRDAATQAAAYQVADPFGVFAQEAQRIARMFTQEGVTAEDVLFVIRRQGYSPDQMMLLEVMYAQHVSRRPALPLSGDLQQDLKARMGTDPGEGAARVDLLLSGGPAALTEYDLKQLTAGIRNKDPQLTMRAILFIQASEGGQELLAKVPEFVDFLEVNVANPAWRGVVHAWDAIKKNDPVRIAAITAVEGIGWVGQKTGEGLDFAWRNGVVPGVGYAAQGVDLAGRGVGYAWNNGVVPATQYSFEQLNEAATAIYGKPLSELASEKMTQLGGAWNDLMSSDPVMRARGVAAAAKEMILKQELDFATIASLGNFVSREQVDGIVKELNGFVAGLPDSVVYVNGERGAFIEYVTQRGGELGEADARMLEAMLAPADETRLSSDAVRQYTFERERLLLQLSDISAIDAHHRGIHGEAVRFHQTICSMQSGARNDVHGRLTGVGLATDVVNAHERMRRDQMNLINHQQEGLEDLRGTREGMRVRAVAILDDLRRGVDGGLSADQNERDFVAFRERDQHREWIVARREMVERWLVDVKNTQAALASWDGWVSFGYAAAKTTLIVGLWVSGVGIPIALGVAVGVNAAEKAYLYAFRGLSAQEALRQFVIEAAFDCAFVGAGKLLGLALRNVKIATPFFRHVATIQRGNIAQKVSTIKVGSHGIRGTEVLRLVDPGLSRGVKNVITKTLREFNKKVGDSLSDATSVLYKVERIYLRFPFRLPTPPPALDLPRTLQKPEQPKAPKMDVPAAPSAGVSAGSPRSQTPVTPAIEPQRPTPGETTPSPTSAGLPQQTPTPTPTTQVERADPAAAAQVTQLLQNLRDLLGQAQGTNAQPVVQHALDLAQMAQLQAWNPRAVQEMLQRFLVLLPPLLAQLPVHPATPPQPPNQEPQAAPSLQQQSEFNEWYTADATQSFVLLDGIFDNASKWFGLEHSASNAPTFQPPPPPKPPTPPEHPPTVPPRNPGNSPGPSSGPGPVLEVVARRKTNSADERVNADAQGDSVPNRLGIPTAEARAQQEKLAEQQQIAHKMAQIDGMLQRQGNANQMTNAHVQLNNDSHSTGLKNAQGQPILHSLALADSNDYSLSQGIVELEAVRQAAAAANERLQRAQEDSAAGGASYLLSPAVAADREAVQQWSSMVSAFEERAQKERAREERHARIAAHERVYERERGMALVDATTAAEGELATTSAAIALQGKLAPQMQTQEMGSSQEGVIDAHSVDVVVDAPLTTATQLQSNPTSEAHSAESHSQLSYSGALNEELAIDPKAAQYTAANVTADVIGGVPQEIASGVTHDVGADFSQEGEHGTDSVRNDAARKEALRLKKKYNREKAAKMRMMIMQQLLAQHFERSKRERLLRMLIALGISEKEYRDLVAQLDAAELKHQEAAGAQVQKEKIAIAIEAFQKPPTAPSMKSAAPKTTTPGTGQSKTRAELYARLRSQQGKQIH